MAQALDFRWDSRSHTVGKLSVTVDNFCSIRYAHYPRDVHYYYLANAALWIGCVRGEDTIVSTTDQGIGSYENEWGASEFFPQPGSEGLMEYYSSQDQNAPEFAGAVSQQDYISHVCDTFTRTAPYHTYDYFAKRPHIPVGVEVTTRSYGWSFAYAEDIIFFDYRITNLNNDPLYNVYVGMSYDPDVSWTGDGSIGNQEDDIMGFRRTYPLSGPCGGLDTINVAWGADNDGDPIDGKFVYGGSPRSVTSVTGLTCLGTSIGATPASFNWWAWGISNYLDYGPQAKPTPEKPYHRFLTGGNGTPYGDVNKYYEMTNGEFDFDQIFTQTIFPGDANWAPPTAEEVEKASLGNDSRFVLSFGPFRVDPGDSINLSFAYVAGERFHRDPNGLKLLKLGNVQQFYDKLDFSDLARNVWWAKRIYDTPGVDTDSDGYAGASKICVLDSVFENGHWVPSAAETTWVKGDGIPDWKGPSPPPPPKVWVSPTLNGIKVRFNGYYSETTRDVFSGIMKFEGYRIYLGLDDREESLALAASYDKLDFDKVVYDPTDGLYGGWVIQDIPMTIEQIRCLYGKQPDPCNDSAFDPLSYTMVNAYHPRTFLDSAFYFIPHDHNASIFGKTSSIRKIYPDAPKPTPDDSLNPDIFTSDGYPKYYEYEFDLTNLLPTIPYYLNVTAFDFGAPRVGLQPLESSKMLGLKELFPYADKAQESGEQQPVYIYPNPYRINGGYREMSFEDRLHEGWIDDKVRAINFVNLPAKCIIRILTLDGDVVQTVNHDMDPSNPMSSHDHWDLINKNHQAVVTGLYYWTVEGTDGNVQIGKLVIIR